MGFRMSRLQNEIDTSWFEKDTSSTSMTGRLSLSGERADDTTR